MPTTTGERTEIGLGPRCARCRTTEARCAWVGSCCSACSHWHWLDPQGNEPDDASRPGRRPIACLACRRIRRACTHKAAS